MSSILSRGEGAKFGLKGGGAKNFARASRTGKNDFVPPDWNPLSIPYSSLQLAMERLQNTENSWEKTQFLQNTL